VGNTPFSVNFPRLYSISNQKEASVGDLWEGGERIDLAFHMAKGTFVWKLDLISNLLELI